MSYTKDDIKRIVERTANRIAGQYGLDPQVLARTAWAIIWKESRYKPDAENKHSTARGLMQVLINTQRETEKKRAKVPFAPAKHKSSAFPSAPVSSNDKMFDPNYNVLIGMHYLAYQLKRYGDINRGIHAYNQGSYPGNHKFDGIKYSDSVQTYMVNNIPDDEFKSGAVKSIVDKLDFRKIKKSTAKVGKGKFVLKSTGAFY